VRYLRAQLTRAGWHGEAFGLVNREDPAWTRERWEHASAELVHAEAAWQQANTLNRLGDRMDGGDSFDVLSTLAADGDERE